MKKSILIDGDIEEVFKTLENVKDFPKFMSEVLDVKASPSGRLSEWTLKLKENVVTWKIMSRNIKPNQAIEFRQVETDKAAVRAVFSVEPVNQYVRLICDVDYLIRKGAIAEAEQKNLIRATEKLLSGFFSGMLRGIQREVESKYV